jgi:hypothetical protein
VSPGGAEHVASIESEHSCAPSMLLVHMSRLAIRWLVIVESAKPEGRRMPPERMDLVWPSVLSMLARAIAVSRMEASEPGEAALFAEMERDYQASRAQSHGDKFAIEGRARAHAVAQVVFLRRFFPVPKVGEWSPAFWGAADLGELGRRLAAAVESEPVVEPVDYPDGWRESVRALGGPP